MYDRQIINIGSRPYEPRIAYMTPLELPNMSRWLEPIGPIAKFIMQSKEMRFQPTDRCEVRWWTWEPADMIHRAKVRPAVLQARRNLEKLAGLLRMGNTSAAQECLGYIDEVIEHANEWLC